MTVRICPVLAAVVMLLAPSCASAADKCRQPDYRSGEPLPPFPPPVSLKEGMEKMGKERVDVVISYAMKLLSSCSIIEGDPYNGSWPEARIAAMVLMDAVLPITVERTDASTECESILSHRNCALWVTYRIENMTEDMTFRSVAVACVGTLQAPDNRRYRIGREPVQYEPIAGNELGPHETRSFQIWFGLGSLAKNYNYSRAQIAKYGGSEGCHVLAATLSSP
jgi:hypothetical protein